MIVVAENPYKSFEVETALETILRIDEGMKVAFATETGEKVSGTLIKISGKGEKTKIQIMPYGEQKQEIWPLICMQEGSLHIDSGDDEDDEVEES